MYERLVGFSQERAYLELFAWSLLEASHRGHRGNCVFMRIQGKPSGLAGCLGDWIVQGKMFHVKQRYARRKKEGLVIRDWEPRIKEGF